MDGVGEKAKGTLKSRFSACKLLGSGCLGSALLPGRIGELQRSVRAIPPATPPRNRAGVRLSGCAPQAAAALTQRPRKRRGCAVPRLRRASCAEPAAFLLLRALKHSAAAPAPRRSPGGAAPRGGVRRHVGATATWAQRLAAQRDGARIRRSACMGLRRELREARGARGVNSPPARRPCSAWERANEPGSALARVGTEKAWEKEAADRRARRMNQVGLQPRERTVRSRGWTKPPVNVVAASLVTEPYNQACSNKVFRNQIAHSTHFS